MDFATVLRAAKLAGAALPAFQALFEAVLPLFTEDDQEKLKAAYAEARERSDEAHEALQAAGKEV